MVRLAHVKPTQTLQTCRSNRGNAPERTSRLVRPQPDAGIARRFVPLPTIADREETQRDHPDGDKDENPNEAEPK
jgi:hypothetical protein